jgi:hypothetical protein
MHFLSYLKCAAWVEKSMLGGSAAETFGAFSFLHIPGQRGKKSVVSDQ